jgi:hypothetical protein
MLGLTPGAEMREKVLRFQFINIYRGLRMFERRGAPMGMTKRDLVEKIRELLRTDADLGFLLKLGGKELESLIASIRERIDRVRP